MEELITRFNTEDSELAGENRVYHRGHGEHRENTVVRVLTYRMLKKWMSLKRLFSKRRRARRE